MSAKHKASFVGAGASLRIRPGFVGSRFASPYGKHVYDILREFAMTWVTEHCDCGYGGRRALYGAERDYFF